MKWPKELSWVRHGQSKYNALKDQKAEDPLYQEFLDAYDFDYESGRSDYLADAIWEKYGLGVGDCNTELTEEGFDQARKTGLKLKEEIDIPDVVFVSPYNRIDQTYCGLVESWPELGEVYVVKEPRLREQEHGLALLYNDWRVFQVKNPLQRLLREIEGPYWYRYPQGESIPDVIERCRSFIGTLVRDYSEKKVFVVSHHITKLSFLAAIQRWDAEEFIRWDTEKKPVNCGLTIFRGNPNVGKEGDGKLELVIYNKKLY